MLFKLTKTEFINKYGELITNIWDKTNTIILADTGPELGMYNHSDIILTYSPDDVLAIQCERAWKKEYTEREWVTLSASALKYGQTSVNEDGISSNVTYNINYIDVVKYRKEWLDWANDFFSQR